MMFQNPLFFRTVSKVKPMNRLVSVNPFATVKNSTITTWYSDKQTCVSSTFKMAFSSRFIPGLDAVVDSYKDALYRVSDYRYLFLKGTHCDSQREKVELNLKRVINDLRSLPHTKVVQTALSDEEARCLINLGYRIIVHLPMVFPKNQRCEQIPHFTPHHLIITGYDNESGAWLIKDPSPQNNVHVLNMLKNDADRESFKSNLYTNQDIWTIQNSRFLLKVNRVFDNFIAPIGGRSFLPQFIIVKSCGK